MVSGAALAPGEIAISWGRKWGGAPVASIAGSDLRTDIFTAAMVNAMSAHADETDDFHVASITHPGCGVVPAALALAEARKLSGALFLRAMVAGYDICCRSTMSLDATARMAAGGATHGVGSLWGASAASAVLMGLAGRQIVHLISYTAQQTAGLSCWRRDPDHVEKAFDFSGAGARNGLQVATMVEHGMTGVEDALEGRLGYLAFFSLSKDPAAAWTDLGERPIILDAAIKRWCVGSPVQSPLDAVEALQSAHAFDPADITGVVVRLPADSAGVVDNGHMANVNCQHLVATAIVDRGLTFHSSHDQARMADPIVRALRDRTTLVHDPALVGAEPPRQGIVEITLKDGRTLRHHAKAVRGTPANPMTWDEIATKAHDLMAPVLGDVASRRVIATVKAIDTLADAGDLARALAKG